MVNSPRHSAGPSPAEVLAAFQRGGVIEVLKLLLASKGISPRGEKNVGGHVDRSSRPTGAASVPSKADNLSPGEMPRSSKDIWLLLTIVAAVYVAYHFLRR